MSKSIATGGLNPFLPSVILTGNNADWTIGNVFSKTLSADATITFTNDTDGRMIVFKVQNTSASSVTLTWPGSVTGANITSISANKTKVFSFIKIETTIYASGVEF